MPEKNKKTGKSPNRTVPLIERAARSLGEPEIPGTTRVTPARRGAKTAAVTPEIDRAGQDAPPPGAQPRSRAPAAPAVAATVAARARGPQPRRSRYAEIDFARLQKFGFLTPSLTRSRTMEEFRVIKRCVLQHAFQPRGESGKPGNLVMVTSAVPGEGKTFTSINLAISTALERDYTVLLIDADFSKPNILPSLGLDAKKGLIDVLEDPSLDLSEVLIRTNIDKLTVLPAGGEHALSTELLASQRMRDVVRDIARRYPDRIIIFDSPPLLSTSEPCTLAMHVGQIVFVIQADKTPQSIVREALDLIEPDTRVGLVLNRCQPQFGQPQFGYYYKR